MRRKAPKIEVNNVFDDMIIVGFNIETKKYIAKCVVCNREKEMYRTVLINHRGTTHTACGKGLKTKNKRFYGIWQSMRSRTTNPNTDHYDCYGGRGINSDKFKNFIDFYDAMYTSYLEAIQKYQDENVVSLDRIDVNGNYEPDNCRWISLAEQKGNTRKNRWCKAVSPQGKVYEFKNQCQFAKEHNLSMKQLNACLTGRFKTHLGWTFSYIEKCND